MSYNWLPPLLNEIKDVAGLDAALKLAEAKGGSRVSIPAHPKENHWLVRLIGKEAAQKLCDHFRVGHSTGCVIDLPVGPSSGANQTRKKIDEMIRDGIPADQIAQKARVHRTTVYRRKKRYGPDPDQLSLFGDD